jgi:hypothetical protein
MHIRYGISHLLVIWVFNLIKSRRVHHDRHHQSAKFNISTVLGFHRWIHQIKSGLGFYFIKVIILWSSKRLEMFSITSWLQGFNWLEVNCKKSIEWPNVYPLTFEVFGQPWSYQVKFHENISYGWIWSS